MTDVFLGPAEVAANREVARDAWLMNLLTPEVSAAARPGRFVLVRSGPDPAQGGTPLLKRPLSIHRIGDGKISLLFRAVGPGTRWLSRTKPGDTLEIMGPLGRGFTWDQDISAAHLVAGGIGLAPLVGLAEALPPSAEKILFYGVSTAAELVESSYLEKFFTKVIVTTENGSKGRAGLVTAPLEEFIRHKAAPVFACGPRPMLKAVAELAAQYRTPAQVSLEEYMACGLGACLGCAAPLAGGGYARVCADGPVFKAEDIAWPGR